MEIRASKRVSTTTAYFPRPPLAWLFFSIRCPRSAIFTSAFSPSAQGAFSLSLYRLPTSSLLAWSWSWIFPKNAPLTWTLQTQIATSPPGLCSKRHASPRRLLACLVLRAIARIASCIDIAHDAGSIHWHSPRSISTSHSPFDAAVCANLRPLPHLIYIPRGIYILFAIAVSTHLGACFALLCGPRLGNGALQLEGLSKGAGPVSSRLISHLDQIVHPRPNGVSGRQEPRPRPRPSARALTPTLRRPPDTPIPPQSLRPAPGIIASIYPETHAAALPRGQRRIQPHPGHLDIPAGEAAAGTQSGNRQDEPELSLTRQRRPRRARQHQPRKLA